MIFTYTCPNCNTEYLVKKPSAERADKELCPECSTPMKRKWTTAFKGIEHDQAFDTMVNKLKHSKPSGKGQIFF